MSGNFKCKFCGTKLTTSCSLNRHMAKNKNCLHIQGKTPEILFLCNNCPYKTSYNSDLTRHKKSCVKNSVSEEVRILTEKLKDAEAQKQIAVLTREIEIRKEQEEFLKTQLAEQNKIIKSKGNININNNNLTMNQKINYCKSVLSPYNELLDELQNIVDNNITVDKLRNYGITQIIRVITENILGHKDKTYYVSISPKDLFYRLYEDKIDTDDKANKLFKDLYPFIAKRSQKVYNDYCRNIKQYEEGITNEDELNKKENEMGDIHGQVLGLKHTDNILRKNIIKAIIGCYNVSSNALKLTDEETSVLSIEE